MRQELTHFHLNLSLVVAEARKLPTDPFQKVGRFLLDIFIALAGSHKYKVQQTLKDVFRCVEIA